VVSGSKRHNDIGERDPHAEDQVDSLTDLPAQHRELEPRISTRGVSALYVIGSHARSEARARRSPGFG